MRPLLLLSLLSALNAQTFSPLNCVATAVPALVRLEGLAERIGDINLNCSGGAPIGLIRGDIRGGLSLAKPPSQRSSGEPGFYRRGPGG